VIDCLAIHNPVDYQELEGRGLQTTPKDQTAHVFTLNDYKDRLAGTPPQRRPSDVRLLISNLCPRNPPIRLRGVMSHGNPPSFGMAHT
jgi:hypothetical protein